MAAISDVAQLITRQAASTAEDSDLVTGHCESGNDFDGRIGVRISAIFVILVGSLFGAWFPVFARRRKGMGIPDWAFFVAKYFGSGVIIATAFIHLLAPAHEALSNPCLAGPITDYTWVEGICLMTIFALFFVELMTMRYAHFGHSHDHGENRSHSHSERGKSTSDSSTPDIEQGIKQVRAESTRRQNAVHVPGEDHLGHARDHTANESLDFDWEEQGVMPETYAAQMTALFILEFGVIFHSVFIGLTLAVSGQEFNTLYVVLVFHQTFEGLGLGSRLSAVPWPKSKRWTPYMLGLAYALSTPIAIAIGLGVRNSYPPGSQTTLIVNGVFDSISAGILIYTGLVELMAHEFLFSPYMRKASLKTILSAFFTVCAGAGLMALLGKWA